MYRTLRNVCLTYLRDRHETFDESNIPDMGEEEIARHTISLKGFLRTAISGE